MSSFIKILTIVLFFIVPPSRAADVVKPTRIITVRDGLPQSYVSGVLQDSNGFLWIATLNGLGRYDGRGFKIYQHTSADTAGLSNNVILHLFNAGNNNFWICYTDDKIDQINTTTGKITHIWKGKSFGLLKGRAGFFKSMVRDGYGNCWMIGSNGIYKISQRTHVVSFLRLQDIGWKSPVIGLFIVKNQLMLLTSTHVLVCNNAGRAFKSMAYPFHIIKPDKSVRRIYAANVRSNGDLILNDAQGIVIWNLLTYQLRRVPMPLRVSGPAKLIGWFDKAGNFFFEYNRNIYILKPNNTIVNWAPATTAIKGTAAWVYVDKSNVLWVGTDGFGLQQFNLNKTGLPGYINHYAFMGDALIKTGVPPKQIEKTFLNKSVEFAHRSTTYKDSIWITDQFKIQTDPQLALYVNKQLTVKNFRNETSYTAGQTQSVRFLSTDDKGILWGTNQHHEFLKFNTKNFTYRVCAKVKIDEKEDINGLVKDGNAKFYVSTSHNLLKVDALSGTTQKLTGFLPTNDLLSLTRDPIDKTILWIGTLSDGLLRFDIRTRKIQAFNTTNGLPNNTIYCILFDNDGQMWCSSNKGIFTFDTNTNAIRSFTSRDGLTDDEFNRFYYMQFPEGNLAFGGPLGYTVFNPLNLKIDNFNPQIALTGLEIINRDVSQQLLNNLKELNLRYNQNFITAEFAAMQFDIPEKIQYRYMLKGLDKSWIMLGNQNKASYTSLPPGNYTLLLNASNTAGKWSSHVPQIKINIATPYWRTWWFYQALFLLLVTFFYIVVKYRIKSFHKIQDQKLLFERQAMELHALALRARMNPHFIFNCLNSIKALIQEKENQKAINYLTTFSILIRNQLNNRSNEITLRDELETCQLYLELEAMRFEDRINYKLNIPDDPELLDTNIPPLILQPVIENAIVHGLLPAEQGGTVSIKVYREGKFGVCEVRDNGLGRAAAQRNKNNSSRLHQSKGMQLLEERITIHNRIHEQGGSLNIIDLFNSDGEASGTLVIIKFNIET